MGIENIKFTFTRSEEELLALLDAGILEESLAEKRIEELV